MDLWLQIFKAINRCISTASRSFEYFNDLLELFIMIVSEICIEYSRLCWKVLGGLIGKIEHQLVKDIIKSDFIRTHKTFTWNKIELSEEKSMAIASVTRYLN